MHPFVLSVIFLIVAYPAKVLAEGPDHAVHIPPVKGIKMIDATKLTVAELVALANAERRNPGPLSCCDWSGGNCMDVHRFLKTPGRHRAIEPD